MMRYVRIVETREVRVERSMLKKPRALNGPSSMSIKGRISSVFSGPFTSKTLKKSRKVKYAFVFFI